jgi:hypothetical protein
MKRCFHRKVDFKTNASNNAHVSQQLHYNAVLLQNDGIIIYVLADQNKLIAKIQVTENNTLPSALSGCTFHSINQLFKNSFPCDSYNVNVMKYWPKNVYKNKVISKLSYLVLCTLSDGDIKQHGLFSDTPDCM